MSAQCSKRREGESHSTRVCKLLSSSGCVYHHVETSIPDDIVQGPGGLSQAGSVAGLTAHHPLPCCFDGDVILLSPLVQRWSLKTLWGGAVLSWIRGRGGEELSDSSSL